MQILQNIKAFFQKTWNRIKKFLSDLPSSPQKLYATIGTAAALVIILVTVLVLALSGGDQPVGLTSSLQTSSVETVSEAVDDTIPNYGPMNIKTADTTPELQKWKDVNSDFVGILEIEGLGLKEPVVSCKNHEEYIHQNIYKKYDRLGVLFFDMRTTYDSAFSAQNTLIYGHNVGKSKYDDRKFGKLMKYRDLESMTWQKADIIKFTSYSGMVFYFKVFAGYPAKDEAGDDKNYYMYTSFAPNTLYSPDDDRYYESFQNFIDTLIARSEFKSGVDVNVHDRILSLSTCAYDSEVLNRYVLHARLLRPSELKALIAEQVTGSKATSSDFLSSPSSVVSTQSFASAASSLPSISSSQASSAISSAASSKASSTASSKASSKSTSSR